MAAVARCGRRAVHSDPSDEQRTSTSNSEAWTSNLEARTSRLEPNLEHEPSTENVEA
jgi:hypothetical protein